MRGRVGDGDVLEALGDYVLEALGDYKCDAGMSVENVAPFMHPTPILSPALPIADIACGARKKATTN